CGSVHDDAAVPELLVPGARSGRGGARTGRSGNEHGAAENAVRTGVRSRGEGRGHARIELRRHFSRGGMAAGAVIDRLAESDTLTLVLAACGRRAGYLIPTTMESGPSKCSTRVSRKPASRIQPWQSAPV